MATATAGDVYYDPYDVDINADPYPTYKRLRDEAPVYFNDRHDFWALSRYDDVDAAFRDWETFSNSRSDILELIQSGLPLPSGVVLFEDPPVHTMHRGVMSRVFTPKRMLALEDQVREYCRRRLDELTDRDRFDVAQEYASYVPMRVIGMLLGIPEEAQPEARARAGADLRTRPGQPLKVVKQESIANGDMFADYVEWRSKHPSDDLMTNLLNAEFEDENGEVRTLTRAEVLAYTQTLSGAGNHTTGRLIGWLVKLLADHPDQRHALLEDRDLLPSAIEETLRYETTGPHISRFLLRDAEFHGTTIPAGSAVQLLVGAANRDERRYEDPDRYDITRRTPHLNFGFGLHFCLGAHLARMEGRVAIEEFLLRYPEWEIDLEASELATTSTVRGWERLGVLVR